MVIKICKSVHKRGEHFDSRHDLEFLDVVPSYERDTKRDLKNLRLASQTTCEAATPYFFRDFDARTPVCRDTTAAEWRQTLLGFSERPWLKYVRTLKIGTRDRNEAFGLPDTARSGLRDRCLVAYAYAIPAFARNCSALQAIRAQIDTAHVGFTADGEPGWQRDLLLLTIANTLRECPRTIASLEISLPLTLDFQMLRRWIVKTPALLDLISQLASISLTVNDATGHGGVRYWETSESENQRQYPNQQYQAGLWDFVQLVPIPSALAIQCTHICDFTRLSHTSFKKLQELKLFRVEISSNTMERVVRESSTSLRAIELDFVELTSGTWSAVLTTLCSLPDLLHCYVDSCGYSATGTSSHFRRPLLPEPDDPEAIETLNVRQDSAALGAVQRHVNSLRKRRSLEQYSEYEYRYMNI